MVCLLRFGIVGSDVPQDLTAPDDAHFGVYEIERNPDGSLCELGRGAIGVTYRAVDPTLQREVALKIIKIDIAKRSVEARERFMREARAAAALRQENIATVFQFGISEETGQCFYAMELIEGETLEDRVRGTGPLDVRTTIDIAHQVTAALAAAEKHGLVHRDLKPANLMLVSADGETTKDDRNAFGEGAKSSTRGRVRSPERDEKLTVKIIDFGLAKALNAPVDPMRLTHDGFVGTPAFASPEQFENAALDVRSDIYSLGATVWFALTGKTPFGGHSMQEIHLAQKSKALPIEQLKAAHVPSRLKSLLESMLAFEPAARPSVQDLAARLQRCAAQATGVRRTRVALAAPFILILGAGAIWLFRGELFRASQFKPPEKSIAVLPFVDLSQARDQEYFCDGISEEILHALAKVDGLRVVGRTSSFSFKGKSLNANEVGRKLNVENVLAGTLRREGNRVRIAAELTNTRSGFHLWAETYDRELAGVFALQDEITRSIVDALKIKLAISLPAPEQRNTEVYDLYLQGLYFSNKGSEEDLQRALSFFQRTVEKDPTFSRAWTGIAKVWYFLADVYVKPLDAYPASKEAALKALALDEKDAEAHCYLSEAKRVLDWDLAGADAELERALQFDPNSAWAHLFSGLHPLFHGELRDGLQLILEAEKLDPVSPITSYVATAAYLANDRIDDAVIEGQRTLQLDPNYFYLDSVLAAAYREKSRFAEAIALYTRAQEATHLPSSGLAITYARMGQQTDAQNILGQLVQARERRYVSAPLIAAVSTAIGDKEEAFRWLEIAYAEHSGVLQWIAFLPEFRALHSDARFPQLLQRIGASQDTILKITETTLSETADPEAQSHFTLKVGVKPRPGTPNGHVVRIIVSFYDLTRDNKMKPTNAQVGYHWLTPASDWSDATTKFLAATYVRPKIQTPSTDGRRYGGFIVRVYFDGQLQDSRANPPDLLTLFPAEQ
jgi:TolB-like protein/serine/threonine protein kinase/predicted Zn-dependent protease